MRPKREPADVLRCVHGRPVAADGEGCPSCPSGGAIVSAAPGHLRAAAERVAERDEPDESEQDEREPWFLR